MNTVTVAFQFTTEAPQDEAALRRSLRNKLDLLAEVYAGEVTTGSVNIELQHRHTWKPVNEGSDGPVRCECGELS